MLPINTLRQCAELFPNESHKLDDWQRGFIQEQLPRLEKWGDDILLSEKQAAVLEKALAAMQKPKEAQQ